MISEIRKGRQTTHVSGKNSHLQEEKNDSKKREITLPPGGQWGAEITEERLRQKTNTERKGEEGGENNRETRLVEKTPLKNFSTEKR